jgi:phosphotriesterase-related protein
MAYPDLSGQVLTVRGPVAPEALGPTLSHEHVLIDIRRPLYRLRAGDDAPYVKEKLTLGTLARTRAGGSLEDNDLIDDTEVVTAEVMAFRQWGGGTIVDQSSIGLGRDPVGLRQISLASGLHIVMGGGYYERQFHPEDIDTLPWEAMAERIERDIVEGVAGTGIRSGLIGEVGIEGGPLTDNEIKSVRAAGRAAAATGAPISFHIGGQGEEKHRVLDLLEEAGADLGHVLFSHALGIADDPDFARRLLGRGVLVELDFLGSTGSPWGTLWPFGDKTAARTILDLLDGGWADRIVLGHDICQKIQLQAYGGHGYSYIPEHFLPYLSRLGVGDDAIDQMMVRNPARWLQFTAPR